MSHHAYDVSRHAATDKGVVTEPREARGFALWHVTAHLSSVVPIAYQVALN